MEELKLMLEEADIQIAQLEEDNKRLRDMCDDYETLARANDEEYKDACQDVEGLAERLNEEKETSRFLRARLDEMSAQGDKVAVLEKRLAAKEQQLKAALRLLALMEEV